MEGPAVFSQSEAKMFLCQENMFGCILKLKSQSQNQKKKRGGQGGLSGGFSAT